MPSVKAAWYADVRRAGSVGRTVFWPAPNVDSGLVALHPARAADDRGDRAAGVRRGRRGVRPAPQDAAGGAAPAGPGRAAGAEDALRAAGVDPRPRGEALGVEEFARAGGTTARRSARGRACLTGDRHDLGDASACPRRSTCSCRVGAPRAGRLPRPGHRLPRRLALRRGRRATAADGLSRHRRRGEGRRRRRAARRRPTSRSRAALLLAERAGVDPDVARCTSRKGIPVAGGMAGGSADAAAALVACDALWGTGLPRAELLDARRRARQRRAVLAASAAPRWAPAAASS